jgi:hypothetical protein
MMQTKVPKSRCEGRGPFWQPCLDLNLLCSRRDNSYTTSVKDSKRALILETPEGFILEDNDMVLILTGCIETES